MGFALTAVSAWIADVFRFGTKPKVYEKDPKAKCPTNLKEWQKMFDMIYGPMNKACGLQKCWLHVHEELCEVSGAYRLGKRRELRNELADLFAWFMSYCNWQELPLGEIVLNLYDERCDTCGKEKCRCPMV